MRYRIQDPGHEDGAEHENPRLARALSKFFAYSNVTGYSCHSDLLPENRLNAIKARGTIRFGDYGTTGFVLRKYDFPENEKKFRGLGASSAAGLAKSYLA